MKARIVAVLIALFGSGFCLVRAYSVEPHSAQQSGWTHGEDGYVSQILTINFDELDSVSGSYCELFAGSRGGGGRYELSVLTYPGGSPIADVAYANGDVDHEWVRFHLQVTRPESIIKGKQLEFKFTRSGGDSVQYYYAENAYDYGHIIIGGTQLQPPPGTAPDLCMRVSGRLRAITSDWWGMVPGCPWYDSDRLGTWRARMETLGVKRADFSIYWDAIESAQGVFDFTALGHDIRACQLDSLLGCRLDARPSLCPAWASSRFEIDSTGDTVMSQYCAPLNLFLPASDTSGAGPVNYWARFIERTVRHYDNGLPPICWTLS
jgi:hypothetical protein